MQELSFDFDGFEEVGNNIEKFGEKVITGLMMEANNQAIKLESEMKINRPWIDRTGDAKKFLRAVAVNNISEKSIKLYLMQGVEYGIWLELANNRNYGIVLPTLETRSQNVLDRLKGIVDML